MIIVLLVFLYLVLQLTTPTILKKPIIVGYTAKIGCQIFLAESLPYVIGLLGHVRSFNTQSVPQISGEPFYLESPNFTRTSRLHYLLPVRRYREISWKYHLQRLWVEFLKNGLSEDCEIHGPSLTVFELFSWFFSVSNRPSDPDTMTNTALQLQATEQHKLTFQKYQSNGFLGETPEMSFRLMPQASFIRHADSWRGTGIQFCCTDRQQNC